MGTRVKMDKWFIMCENFWRRSNLHAHLWGMPGGGDGNKDGSRSSKADGFLIHRHPLGQKASRFPSSVWKFYSHMGCGYFGWIFHVDIFLVHSALNLCDQKVAKLSSKQSCLRGQAMLVSVRARGVSVRGECMSFQGVIRWLVSFIHSFIHKVLLCAC